MNLSPGGAVLNFLNNRCNQEIPCSVFSTSGYLYLSNVDDPHLRFYNKDELNIDDELQIDLQYVFALVPLIVDELALMGYISILARTFDMDMRIDNVELLSLNPVPYQVIGFVTHGKAVLLIYEQTTQMATVRSMTSNSNRGNEIAIGLAAQKAAFAARVGNLFGQTEIINLIRLAEGSANNACRGMVIELSNQNGIRIKGPFSPLEEDPELLRLRLLGQITFGGFQPL